jgi:hypothetical protein
MFHMILLLLMTTKFIPVIDNVMSALTILFISVDLLTMRCISIE